MVPQWVGANARLQGRQQSAGVPGSARVNSTLCKGEPGLRRVGLGTVRSAGNAEECPSELDPVQGRTRPAPGGAPVTPGSARGCPGVGEPPGGMGGRGPGAGGGSSMGAVRVYVKDEWDRVWNGVALALR